MGILILLRGGGRGARREGKELISLYYGEPTSGRGRGMNGDH